MVEALVVLAFVVFYVYEVVTGATDDVTRATTSGALILVFGVGLLALARGWWRGADWARTPPCSGTPCCCPWRGPCASPGRDPWRWPWRWSPWPASPLPWRHPGAVSRRTRVATRPTGAA